MFLALLCQTFTFLCNIKTEPNFSLGSSAKFTSEILKLKVEKSRTQLELSKIKIIKIDSTDKMISVFELLLSHDLINENLKSFIPHYFSSHLVFCDGYQFFAPLSQIEMHYPELENKIQYASEIYDQFIGRFE